MTSIKTNKKIILASSSPRRRELLQMMQLDFTIEPSEYEEDMTLDLSPSSLAKELSMGKAYDVYKKHVEENAVIIGADTFVVLDGNLLGKPKDEIDARKMLMSLSNQEHIVITGLAVIDCETGEKYSMASTAKVKFRELEKSEIENYIKSGEPLDKADAYAIQGIAAPFIESVSGDYYTIVGLPLNALFNILKKIGAIDYSKFN